VFKRLLDKIPIRNKNARILRIPALENFQEFHEDVFCDALFFKPIQQCIDSNHQKIRKYASEVVTDMHGKSEPRERIQRFDLSSNRKPKVKVTALGFGTHDSDVIRLNNLVKSGYVVYSASKLTIPAFNEAKKKQELLYNHRECDFKGTRGFKHVLEFTRPHILLLDYFFLVPMWYTSGGSYGCNWFVKGGHVELALLTFDVKKFILPIDNPESGKSNLLASFQRHKARLQALGIIGKTVSQIDALKEVFLVKLDLKVNERIEQETDRVGVSYQIRTYTKSETAFLILQKN
jgi:hypothetical protein